MAEKEEIQIILKAFYEGQAEMKKMLTDLDKTNKAKGESNKTNATLSKGLKGLASSLGLTGGKVGQMATSIAGMASASALAVPVIGAMAVAFVKLGQAIWGASKYAMDFAWQVKDIGMRTGATRQEVLELGIIAKKSGMSIEDASKMIEVFDLKMANMQSGGKKTKEALKRLGIEVENLDGTFRNSFALWDEFARKAEQLGNIDRSEVATDIFGRLGSQKALRMLDAYTAKMEYARELTKLYNTESMDGWLQMKGVMQDIGTLWEILRLQMSNMFLPMMEMILPAIRSFMDWASTSETLIVIFSTLKEIFHGIGIAIGFVLDLLHGVLEIVDVLTSAFQGFYDTNIDGSGNMISMWEAMGVALRGAFARPMMWLWDVLAKMYKFMSDGIRKVVTEHAQGIDKFGEGIKTFLGGISNAITSITNGVTSGVQKMINFTIGLINGFLSNVNRITKWIEKTTGAKVGTDFQIEDVSIRKTDNTEYIEFLDAQWGGLSDKILDGLTQQDAFWGQDNPFTDWLFKGGQKTGLLAGQGTQIDRDEYQRSNIGLSKMADSLGTVNKELEKQTQAYKIIYGAMFGTTRGFFNLLGQTTQPKYASFESAGKTYGTTGGLSQFNIENMNVRTEADIVRVAQELDKIQKKDARKQGQAYGF